MTRSASQKRFESHLAPVLPIAYRMAYCLTCSHEDAEDVVQATALRAFKAFDTFQGGTNFTAWFLCILKNVFRELYRRHRLELALIARGRAAQTCIASHQELTDLCLRRLERREVLNAFAQLSPACRMICVLYFVDEMTYQEIADIVGCPIGTVRSRLHRSRRSLQRSLRRLL